MTVENKSRLTDGLVGAAAAAAAMGLVTWAMRKKQKKDLIEIFVGDSSSNGYNDIRVYDMTDGIGNDHVDGVTWSDRWDMVDFRMVSETHSTQQKSLSVLLKRKSDGQHIILINANIDHTSSHYVKWKESTGMRYAEVLYDDEQNGRKFVRQHTNTFFVDSSKVSEAGAMPHLLLMQRFAVRELLRLAPKLKVEPRHLPIVFTVNIHSPNPSAMECCSTFLTSLGVDMVPCFSHPTINIFTNANALTASAGTEDTPFSLVTTIAPK
eukprot:TRINITY_DN6443_c0_g1_i1.p1 TRINITY_DN6443_c0_g1~~TRINITY_DN6443_c0_g1_i1.p1  ORF type:complete len:266 (+),score=30.27 TRINITY_DN6443_c0_g1_i1:68-865(+)